MCPLSFIISSSLHANNSRIARKMYRSMFRSHDVVRKSVEGLCLLAKNELNYIEISRFMNFSFLIFLGSSQNEFDSLCVSTAAANINERIFMSFALPRSQYCCSAPYQIPVIFCLPLFLLFLSYQGCRRFIIIIAV